VEGYVTMDSNEKRSVLIDSIKWMLKCSKEETLGLIMHILHYLDEIRPSEIFNTFRVQASQTSANPDRCVEW
jgi:hypothetical protein